MSVHVRLAQSPATHYLLPEVAGNISYQPKCTKHGTQLADEYTTAISYTQAVSLVGVKCVVLVVPEHMHTHTHTLSITVTHTDGHPRPKKSQTGSHLHNSFPFSAFTKRTKTTAISGTKG